MKASITVLPGDGVGPEVVGEARKVLDAIARRFGHEITYHEALIGGCAIDKTGEALPASTIEACRGADAVLLGAVGGPKWDDPNAKVRPEAGLLGLRKSLGLYANLRPTTVLPSLASAGPVRADITRGVDLMIVRELAGGMYFGAKGRTGEGAKETAFDTEAYSVAEVERIVRVAGEIARARTGKLTSIDKANVLESSRLWRATAERVVKSEFPDLTFEHMLVDAAAMHLIRQPTQFDVIVTSNMFGDILTDEASILAGSIGLMGSASLGDGGPGLYEPIHGSAPDIAGKEIVNPVGAIYSAAMLCRHSLEWHKEAALIEAAVEHAIKQKVRTVDIACRGRHPVRTSEMGDAIVATLEQIDLAFSTSKDGTCAPTQSNEASSERRTEASSKQPETSATKTSTSPSSPSQTVTWISSRGMLISIPSDNT